MDLDPSLDLEFWNFSHHESALEDYPAAIDYVLNVTRQEELFFVGYSMGTTQYLVLLSEKPEYNDKIAAGFLLGPTAIGKHATNPMVVGSPYAEHIEAAINWLGFYEFMPNYPEIKSWFARNLCDRSDLLRNICKDMFAMMVGMDRKNMNSDMVPVYLSHMPAGCNVRTMAHLGQLFRNGEDFSQYDHGVEGNLANYGHPHPARYDLSNVKAATALFGGQADGFAVPKDLEILANKLPNLLANHVVAEETFAHLDFIFGTGAKTHVHEPMIQMMRSLK